MKKLLLLLFIITPIASFAADDDVEYPSCTPGDADCKCHDPSNPDFDALPEDEKIVCAGVDSES